MFLHDQLDTLQREGPTAILIRHAEREPIDRVEATVRAPLTPNGEAAARALGRRLQRLAPLRAYHSPVRRCRQTALALAEGLREAGGALDVRGVLPTLGGPYLTDWAAAMEQVMAFGMRRFVRAWFDGTLQGDWVAESRAAARQQLQILTDQVRDPAFTGCTLNVTHDWNLLLVREYCLQLRHEEVGWPDFLEGIVATRLGDQVLLQLGPHRRELPFDWA